MHKNLNPWLQCQSKSLISFAFEKKKIALHFFFRRCSNLRPIDKKKKKKERERERLETLTLYVGEEAFTCEQLDRSTCAFAVSSSGVRCVLEKRVSGAGLEEYCCQSSGVEVAGIHSWIETDVCVANCGLDRDTLGISSDSMLDKLVFPSSPVRIEGWAARNGGDEQLRGSRTCMRGRTATSDFAVVDFGWPAVGATAAVMLEEEDCYLSAPHRTSSVHRQQ
ncbi:hypothetical protein AXF42_Ash020651 [Apostasia shenzhenica]|uniref:Uncharacterized protein n=1 Tax=Apostasia shenzhenica TaxID=1088818 RepID=A0A2H9ZY97_9ASPA|nr:hypothetical protein AXF42_Ash020651 [Apostasia shenzhenica]